MSHNNDTPKKDKDLYKSDELLQQKMHHLTINSTEHLKYKDGREHRDTNNKGLYKRTSDTSISIQSKFFWSPCQQSYEEPIQRASNNKPISQSTNKPSNHSNGKPFNGKPSNNSTSNQSTGNQQYYCKARQLSCWLSACPLSGFHLPTPNNNSTNPRFITPYCFQFIDPQLDDMLKEFLTTLAAHQRRLANNKPLMLKSRMRFVHGINQVRRKLTVPKGKMLIIAANYDTGSELRALPSHTTHQQTIALSYFEADKKSPSLPCLEAEKNIVTGPLHTANHKTL